MLTPAVSGGRGPTQRTRLVPWGDHLDDGQQAMRPWPGRLPSPAPSVIIDPPRPMRVLDALGHTVLVTDRGTIPAPPHRFHLDQQGNSPVHVVTAWAGPWPVDERWWDTEAARHLARMQLVDSAGHAYLTCFDVPAQHWLLEGIYD